MALFFLQKKIPKKSLSLQTKMQDTRSSFEAKKKKTIKKKNFENTIRMLEQREMLKEAVAKSAKPVPKNILR